MSKLREDIVPLALVFITLAGIITWSPVFATETLQIAGTGTAIGTMKMLASAFEKTNPGIKVQVLPSVGSSGGIKAVAKGVIDIGLISRALKEGETNLGLSVTEYAKTPFILVVRENLPVGGLSSRDIAKIYRGETQTWTNGERIRLIMRPATETDTLLAKNISREMSRAVDAALSREGMLIALTDQDSIEMLEKTPGAIGFSTLTQVIAEKRRLKILSLDGALPVVKSRVNVSYPFFKTLSLVTKPEPSHAVRRFIDFVLTERGLHILEESGNLPLVHSSGR
jgi:phosphate transport system substrate-binding protein